MNTIEKIYNANNQYMSTFPQPLERFTSIKNTIANWRHHRMLKQAITPLLQNPGDWLTIGDGFGSDAFWLIQRGKDVIASDICTRNLEISQKAGYILEYAGINAESIEMEADSIEYVLCKESFHHFPRPFLSIYEMIRVAKSAVIMIEPNDPIQSAPALLALKNILDKFSPKLIRQIWKNQFSYEPTGNYIFKLSEREIEKIATALNLYAYASKGINDILPSNPKFYQSPPKKLFREYIKLKFAIRDLLSKFGILPPTLICCIIFKTEPTQETIKALKNHGFKFHQLPQNPFI